MTNPWMVYHRKIKGTGAVNLYDCGEVGINPLLFFGDNFQLNQEDGRWKLYLDKMVQIECCRRSGNVLLQLRELWDKILLNTMEKSGRVGWTHKKEPDIFFMGKLVEFFNTNILQSEQITPIKSEPTTSME